MGLRVISGAGPAPARDEGPRRRRLSRQIIGVQEPSGPAFGPGDLVLDVGARTGALTTHLVAAGARVVAVELHAVRARLLRQRLGVSITAVQADAADLRLPGRPFRVVANPPFGVATALLRRLLALHTGWSPPTSSCLPTPPSAGRGRRRCSRYIGGAPAGGPAGSGRQR